MSGVVCLANEASVGATFRNGATPLFVASQKGHAGVVKLLLKKRARVDAAMQDGATPLFMASQLGHAHIVELLVGKGARVDAAMQDGATPLFIASQRGHAGVVGLLLENGAPVDAATHVVTRRGVPPAVRQTRWIHAVGMTKAPAPPVRSASRPNGRLNSTPP